ncbi:IS110 family transposase [Glutamicibacter halophytocola]|uniref:IS110 family transposase n=1 Tax=Glutamicibacter halophytocola TaxID=1933880 RepID=A0A5B8IJW1_9MICC|nr:IS110 family transposase [Glutamicibacter halophytocola]QDY66478.1 IS110 family transposase [Glutamicibacter halophytocola]QDY66592.1 IS110 family transposase [Glutamicibacter halophytocola]UUX58583.1 IS110 family transposase [Glutamicibacter halophytocola]UUX60380.1 IS110 family transposase [Glutamicibacter halophytocola]
MSIVAHSHSFVVGVDTHARKHVYALIDTITGALLDTNDFPTSATGINRAIAWVSRRTEAATNTLWVIEGAATYGAILAGVIAARNFQVVEAPFMGKRQKGAGKSDVIDAHRMATAVLGLQEEKLRQPRANEGIRQGLRILLSARESMTHERTRAVNALNALVRANPLGVDARQKLNVTQIGEISRWREREEELSLKIARAEAVRLAKHVSTLDEQLKNNESQLDELVRASEASALLNETGFKAITAAKCLVAWSHAGRVRSEAAFAALAGTSPIPASSGNTSRHRLNRGGDRTLNSALHMVAVTCMAHDRTTREYVEKRRAEGKTDREIRRCLKRYLARRVFKILSAVSITKIGASAAA